MRPAWVRGTALFLASQTVSLFGSAVVGYALIWYITLETRSGWLFTCAVLAGMVSQGLVSLVGGVWADRYNRKALIMVSDGAIALVTAGLAVAIIAGAATLPLIMVAMVARGIGGGLQTPAVSAVLPQLVPQKHLMRVNSINTSIQSAIFLASPAVAGLLIGPVDLGWILLVDVVTAVIGIGILATIPVTKVTPIDTGAERPRRALSEMLAAWRYTKSNPALFRVLLLFLAMYLLIIPQAQLAPLVVVKLFGDAPWMLATVEIAWSVGMIVGGAILAAWGGTRNRMTMMLVVGAIWAALTVGMGLAPWFWVYAALWVAFGLSQPGVTTTAVTVLQQEVPPELLGRVMGLATVVMSLAAPIGLIVVGPLADVVSIRAIIVACGAASLAVTAALSWRAPALMAPEDAPATGSE